MWYVGQVGNLPFVRQWEEYALEVLAMEKAGTLKTKQNMANARRKVRGSRWRELNGIPVSSQNHLQIRAGSKPLKQRTK